MTPAVSYEEFLRSKVVVAQPCGFTPQEPKAELFEFQSAIVRWAVQRGRAALIEDCGLGKGCQELEWARQVTDHTGLPVLGLAPLAVAKQFEREAAKFGYPVTICDELADLQSGINITNYERLGRFEGSEFGGLFLDESSILKGFDGKFRQRVTEFGSRIPYRLAASATPSPNDYMELGNHAEFLGIMTTAEMLATFFTHDGGDTSKWRLKGHARKAFWEWVASWAVCLRKPSDLGYSDQGYDLPPLEMHQHTVSSGPASDTLFTVEARTLSERSQARRDSLQSRVDLCAGIVNASSDQWVIWCNLNAESEALHYSIKDAVQVCGADKPEFKEQVAVDFAEGRVRVLVTKPTIFGFGLNWQNCSSMAFVGLSDSYEQMYQAIRRCWRFGQTRPVQCHVITSEAEGAVVQNIHTKERQAREMFEEMVTYMKDINTRAVRGAVRERVAYQPVQALRLPSWIEGAA